jgi:hypothetical protein
MFVRWSCDCIGIIAEGNDGIVIIACDEDRDTPADSLSWFRRDMSDKTVVPLTAEAEQTLHTRIARRFGKADRFDDVQSALGIQAE